MLEHLGNIGEFIGGIAVIVTLIYLTIQVRHNTQATRTASLQDLVISFRDLNNKLINPEIERAFRKGIKDYPNMPESERGIFVWLTNDHALFFQSAMASRDSGTLDGETYERYLAYFCSWLITPGGANWWQEIRNLYTTNLVREVEQRFAKGELPDLLSLNAFNFELGA